MNNNSENLIIIEVIIVEINNINKFHRRQIRKKGKYHKK